MAHESNTSNQKEEPKTQKSTFETKAALNREDKPQIVRGREYVTQGTRGRRLSPGYGALLSINEG